jgi:hypothetical protein
MPALANTCFALLFLAHGLAAQQEQGFFTGRWPVASLGLDIYSPTMTEDELYILFASRRAGGAGGWDLWEARRPGIQTGWGPATPVAQLNGPADDFEAGLSRNGLELYFVSNRVFPALGPHSILRSTRATLTSPWSAPVPLGAPVNGANDNNHDPRLTSDGLTMFFASNGNGADLFLVTRPNLGAPWQNRQGLATINTGAAERSPLPDGDGGILYFASDRPGGLGGLDQYITWRLPGGGFSPPLLVTDLSSAFDDQNGWVGARTGRMMVSVVRAGQSFIDIWCPTPVHGIVLDRPWQTTTTPTTGGGAPILATREYLFSTTQPGDSRGPIEWYDWTMPPPPEGALLLLSLGTGPAFAVPGFRGHFGLNAGAMVSLGFFGVQPNNLANIPPVNLPRDPSLAGLGLEFQVAWLFLQSQTGSFSDIVRLRLTP